MPGIAKHFHPPRGSMIEELCCCPLKGGQHKHCVNIRPMPQLPQAVDSREYMILHTQAAAAAYEINMRVLVRACFTRTAYVFHHQRVTWVAQGHICIGSMLNSESVISHLVNITTMCDCQCQCFREK